MTESETKELKKDSDAMRFSRMFDAGQPGGRGLSVRDRDYQVIIGRFRKEQAGEPREAVADSGLEQQLKMKRGFWRIFGARV